MKVRPLHTRVTPAGRVICPSSIREPVVQVGVAGAACAAGTAVRLAVHSSPARRGRHLRRAARSGLAGRTARGRDCFDIKSRYLRPPHYPRPALRGWGRAAQAVQAPFT
ncbi:hypothetical protein GCM10017782_05150 [Deinococcus ficus]|nr:hypothetical protein GCM10017782_05150 [Deinococcus ficus]